MRQLAGVVVRDLPRYLRAMAQRDGGGWLRLSNRSEQLEAAPDGSGYRCLWQWSSDLHAPKHLPVLGSWLVKRALRDHPIEFSAQPAAAGRPQISFIIGHRGRERLPHLLATLSSIAAQRDVPVECLVIEQDRESCLSPHLPKWVRHIHTPPPDSAMPYSRSWAFNVGAQHAATPCLVLHDNDILVPADYAAQVLRRSAQGFDAINLKRFVFYLTPAHTRAFFNADVGPLDAAPAAIVQNLEGGGSAAITRTAFDRIGGMDESFVGWGGEDNEFWERAETLRVWPWANLPLVHLWHPPQPDKLQRGSQAQLAFDASRKLAPAQRIERLRALQQGQPEAPLATALAMHRPLVQRA